MEIYKIISDIMKNQNLSVADIAKKSNLPDSTVRGIITRKHKDIALDNLNNEGQKNLMDYAEYIANKPEYKKCDTISEQEIS